MSDVARDFKTNVKLKKARYKESNFIEGAIENNISHCKKVTTCQAFAGNTVRCRSVSDFINQKN